MSELRPPGWYRRVGSEERRWWDGNNWTDSVEDSPPSLRADLDSDPFMLAGDSTAASFESRNAVTPRRGTTRNITVTMRDALGATFGLGALMVGLLFYSFANGPDGYLHVEAAVVDAAVVPDWTLDDPETGSRCLVVVSYVINGTEYTTIAGMEPSVACDVEEGEERGVYVNQEDPGEAVLDRPIPMMLSRTSFVLGVGLLSFVAYAVVRQSVGLRIR